MHETFPPILFGGKEKNKVKNMKFNQMKFQKIAVIGAFILAVLTFVYAYSFSTPFFPLSDNSDLVTHLPEGKEFYEAVQPFNRNLATFSVIFILVSLLLFMSFSQKRRRYYIFNYIAIGAYTVSGLAYSIFSFINLIDFSARYSQINFDDTRVGLEAALKKVEGNLGKGVTGFGRYDTESAYQSALKAAQDALDNFNNNTQTETCIFILGFILFAAIIIVSGLLIFNCFWKAKKLKAEDAEYAEEDARILAAQQAHQKALEEAMNEEA